MTAEIEKHLAVDSLLDEAWAARLRDYDVVLNKGKQALTLARAQDYPLGIVRALNAIAWGYNRKAQHDLAANHANEALHIARQHHFTVEEGYALCNMSLCYSVGGQPDRAMESLLLQLHIGETHGNAELVHIALNDIGALHLQNSELKDALRSLQRSLAVLEDNNVDFPVTVAEVNIASIYLQQGDYAAASRLVEHVLSVTDGMLVADTHMVALSILAKIHIASSDLASAEAVCERGLALVHEQDGNPIHFLMMLGEIYIQQGDPHAALAYYGRAVTHAEGRQLVEDLPPIYGALSTAFEQIGDLEQALTFSRKNNAALEKALTSQAETQARVLRTLYGIADLEQELAMRERDEQLEITEARLRVERDIINTVKRRVLERISHEFRTPLSVLRTSMSILMRYGDKLTAEQKQKHEDKINTHFKHIGRLLDNILSVLRAMDEQAETHPLPMDMVELCRDAVEKSNAPERVDFVPHDPTLLAVIDESYAFDIITNLLTNALKYSEDTVEVSLEQQDDTMHLSIRDDGIGILPEEQTLVFEPLARGSNIDEIPGIGLGLSIVDNDVRLLGGRIEVDSTPGEGTTFYVVLPITPPDPAR